MEEIPAHEGTVESNPLPTPEKEIDQRNNTVHQLEAALRELLERQTREAALASEAGSSPKAHLLIPNFNPLPFEVLLDNR
ncbi:hypothetical protein PIB30_079740 [Stylosanthes scabra]|uniref:Uncharacterized protein n=1 Tax=Stylosanthes scabra TaxID=79078 RepID=A0ABU6ZPT6_9FABA|nr:hypothetical protein [Stylosanthes scabra]